MKLGEAELRRPGTVEMNGIRTKLRSIARLLAAAQLFDKSIRDIDSLLRPVNFHTLISASRKLAADSPQIGIALGGYVKQLNLIAITEAITRGEQGRRKLGEDFLYIFNAQWQYSVSAVSAKRQKLAALNKLEELPLAEDVERLSKSLRADIANYKSHSGPFLTKLCLAFWVIFNKRRLMEVAELKVSDYLKEINRDVVDNSCILNSLDSTEKLLSKRMKAIEVRGKSTRGLRKVFIIVPMFMMEALQMLATPVKIFLFQRPCSDKPLNGTEAVREIVKRCDGLQRPDLLHAQKFRKFLATTYQVINMSNDELEMVAEHMGHSTNIHTNVYRLRQNLMERAKMASILLAAEQGSFSKYSTTQLEHIIIDEIAVYDAEMGMMIADSNAQPMDEDTNLNDDTYTTLSGAENTSGGERNKSGGDDEPSTSMCDRVSMDTCDQIGALPSVDSSPKALKS